MSKKPLFLLVVLLTAVPLAQAADVTLRIVGDARPQFKTMMSADQLKNGMNLLSTDPTGVKLWANLKSQGGFIAVDWAMTDLSGKALESSLVRIESASSGSPRSEERCLECTEPKNGPRVCHEVPCPVRVPCCPNHHFCCIK